jgi:hypothetical protein
MANYCCTIRTNYFHVKDEDKFRDLMGRVYGCEDSVELWEEKDSDGKTVFGFGVYGGISGLRNAQEDEDDDIDESSYDEFIDGLQECVADNDAIIIMEAGNEKMRYVVGSASIITSKEFQYMDIADLATRKAAELLGNTDWSTKCSY